MDMYQRYEWAFMGIYGSVWILLIFTGMYEYLWICVDMYGYEWVIDMNGIWI